MSVVRAYHLLYFLCVDERTVGVLGKRVLRDHLRKGLHRSDDVANSLLLNRNNIILANCLIREHSDHRLHPQLKVLLPLSELRLDPHKRLLEFAPKRCLALIALVFVLILTLDRVCCGNARE